MCDEPRCFQAFLRRARKAYRCCECRSEIAPGELHEYASGVWEAPASYRTCLPCAEQRHELERQMLAEDPWEVCFGFGELRSAWFEWNDVTSLRDRSVYA